MVQQSHSWSHELHHAGTYALVAAPGESLLSRHGVRLPPMWGCFAGNGPRLNYPASLKEGCLVFRQTEEETGQSTDKRDVALLYSLCS